MKKNRDKAWAEVFAFPLAGRQPKPRTTGLTMVIDKGLGLTETKDLLELASDYIDFIKLGFGTSAFYSTELLREKIRLIKSYGVDIYPGGTFLEVAVIQKRLEQYLETAYDLGFNFVEVSDGTITMTPAERKNIITRALATGFRVITEVGKKDPQDKVTNLELHEMIASDLEQGAFKVIVEGRESGKGVVIYNQEGDIIEDDFNELVSAVKDLSYLIWEAPLKNQQQDLILKFGPNVSLGNIQPGDILSLEALRVGLRGDTLRACLVASGSGKIDLD